MTDLSLDLKNSIVDLQTRHSALLTAVQTYRNGSVGASKAEITAAIAALETRLNTEESTLMGMAGRGVQPSLCLDFMKDMYLMGDSRPKKGYNFADLVTFTRSSTGTYFNSAGVLTQAAVNQPRFDYDPVTKLTRGLLIEEGRTNFSTYSGQISSLTYTAPGILTPNAVVAPDGTLTGSMLENVTSSGSYIGKAVTGLVDGGTYTRSIYVKSNGVDPFTIIFEGVGWAGTYTAFDVVAKTFSGSAAQARGYVDVGNGWLRVYVTGVNTVGATTVGSAFYIGGYPTTSVQHRGYVWGIQTEAGAFAASYIPTPASFTGRSSTALYLDSNGVFQTAASGVARSNAYGYDSTGALRSIGLLIEKSATRLNTSGSSFASTGKQEMTVSLTGATVKGLPETKLIPTSATDSHRITVHTHTVDSVASRNSVIAKAGEYRYLILTRKNSYVEVNDQYARFDLQTGTIQADYTGSARITPLGDGLYRCEMTATNTNSTTNSFSVAVESSISSVGYNKTAGDGTSGLYLYHAQCEDGAVATSPMIGEGSQITRAADISTSAQVTRTADVANVNTLSPWFNAAEGTLFVDVEPTYSGVTNWYASLTNDTLNNVIDIGMGVGGKMRSRVLVGAATQAIMDSVAVAAKLNKAAIAYKKDNIGFSSNGAAAVVDTLGEIPTGITKLGIGRISTYQYSPGYIRNLRYYPRRLTNAQLQAMTA